MPSCHCERGWICEQHPGTCWPHDTCAGPGMQCENPACPSWADSPPEATRLDQSFIEWPLPPLDPTAEFREPCWRFVGPSNRILRCEIVGVTTGWEVQTLYEGDAEPDPHTARRLASRRSDRGGAVARGGRGDGKLPPPRFGRRSLLSFSSTRFRASNAVATRRSRQAFWSSQRRLASGATTAREPRKRCAEA
jgi:hypothetical protein